MGSNIAAFLLVVATLGNCMLVKATGTLASTEDTAAKILLMEKTIDALRTQTQDTANMLQVILPQLLDCKAQDGVMLQKIKLLENNLQEQSVNQVQQLKNQTARVGVLEKRATDTELRVSNLEITDKTLSSSLQSQITFAYQKLHAFSVKQGNLETSIKDTANMLQVIQPQLLDCKAKDTVMLQKIKLVENNLQQQSVNQVQQLKNQTTRVVALEKRATDTELRVSNLEVMNKSLSSSQQSQITFAYQKLHAFSVKQGNLERSIKDTANMLQAIQPQLLECKAKDNVMMQKIKLVENNLQEQSVNQVQQLKNQTTRVGALEKRATDTELRVANLEITDKTLSSSLQSQIIFTYQKLHDFSLKQGNLETSIKNQDKALKTLKDASTTAKAKQGLLERQIQNTESKQSMLHQAVANQATQLITLVNKATSTRNYKQFTWNQDYDKNAMTIKMMYFNKKTAHSGLSLSFYGVLRSYAAIGYKCNRWWFELNGAECANPAKIEGLIISNNNYFSSSVVSGICNGIPAGTVKIAFKVGDCGALTVQNSLGDAHTGFGNLANRIVIEEIGI